jgi:hypothetical protein
LHNYLAVANFYLVYLSPQGKSNANSAASYPLQGIPSPRSGNVKSLN